MRDKGLDLDSRNDDDAHAPGLVPLVWTVLGLLLVMLFLLTDTGRALMVWLDGAK